MTFPSLSQMATPLGDLLPMRLSWLFIGYSTQYQVFSGVMETAAGLLLLPRRTVTLGLIAATGAFLNVVMINLSYDVPVKLFASHLLLACVFLLAQDARRLFGLLALNQGAPPTALYEPPDRGPRVRAARIAAKAVMILLILVMPSYSTWQRARASAVQVTAVPLTAGVYDVRHFVVKGDTIPMRLSDTTRWRDIIIDNPTQGSVGTTDTLFWQRYRRGHFRYSADTARRTLVGLAHLVPARQHARPSPRATNCPTRSTARLWTTIRGDSVYVELVRTDRRFQLAERQFHWLSEWNR